MCYKIVGLELDYVCFLQDKSNDHVGRRAAIYACYFLIAQSIIINDPRYAAGWEPQRHKTKRAPVSECERCLPD